MLLPMLIVPATLNIPPPLLAVLKAMVLLRITPSKAKIPPPLTPAVLPDTVELVRVTVPLALIPPPNW